MRTRTGLDMWSAPETRQGGEYSESIDFWGVGVITYFMVMMQPPFYDGNDSKLNNKVQSCKYTKIPKDIKDLYSPAIFELIQKLLVAKPAKRPTAT